MRKTPRYIFLTKGKIAVVDFDDYDWLSQRKWYYHDGYAMSGHRDNIRMHRLVLRVTEGQVGHINQDKLDNRKCNLRECSPSQNSWNKQRTRRSTTGFKGVYPYGAGRWRVQIRAYRKLHHVGLYNNREAAAKAYDEAAEKMHGMFACKNL